MSRAHVYFRRDVRFQKFLRCTRCGFVARAKGSHIAHANGIHKPHEEVDE